MTRRILLACLLLLACGLGFTAWFLAGTTDSAATEVAQATRPATAATPAALAGATELEGVPPLETSVEEPSAGGRAAVPHDTETSYDVLVLDERGRPIAGAEVRRTLVYGVPGNEAEHEDLGEPLLTDERGHCTFSAPGDLALFHVRAEGYYHGSQFTPELTVMLGPAVTISGRVLEEGTLLPISGAEVRPLAGDCQYCDPRATTSDGLGRYTVQRFPRGPRIGLDVQAAGFLARKEPFKLHNLAATTLDVMLQPSAEVWLEFFDIESGAPLEKVYVRGKRKHKSDAQGQVRVRDLVAAGEKNTRVSAKLRGYAEARITLEPEHQDALMPLRVPMVPLRSLTGSVQDESGALIYAASIWATDVSSEDAEELWRSARQEMFDQGPRKLRFKVRHKFAKPARDGTYEITGVAPWIEELEFRVGHRDYIEVTGRRRVPPRPDTAFGPWTLRLSAARTGSVRGLLTLNGTPTGGLVRWTGIERSGQDRAAADGSFLLEEVELGSVRLDAAPAGLDRSSTECARLLSGSWTATVLSGQTARADLDVRLPMARLSGHVRYSDGEPIPDQMVDVSSADWCAILIAYTDASGWWSREVPSGLTSWTVSVGDAHEVLERRDLRPGTTGIDFMFPRPGSLRLRVLDGPTGRPITKLGLRWQRPGDSAPESVYELPHGLPDPAGWFEFQTPGGVLDLAVSTRGQDRSAQPAFAFGVDTRRAQTLELVIQPGHRVDLKLRKGQEPWPKDVEVYLLARHERGAVVWDEDQEMALGGDLSTGHGARDSRRLRFSGRKAKLTGLPPGRYEFVSFPDTIRVHPGTVRAGPGAETVLVRWERR